MPTKREELEQASFTVVIDDVKIHVDAAALTFGEQRRMRKAITDLAFDDADADALYTPALVWISLVKAGRDDVTLEWVTDNLTIGATADAIDEKGGGENPEG